MQPLIEIFSQGDEVLRGQTVDTNAAWLSQKVIEMGFVVTRHTAVGDNLHDLKTLLNEISNRADCCICTGGLGPTLDDLTAQAVAEAFGRPLQFDSVALQQITEHYTRRNRVMADANRKQAFFPKGSERIDNEWGTAPGFAVQQNRCWFVFFPGVPSEMQVMFVEKIAPLLLQRFSLQPDRLITLRSVGIGESDLQEKFNTIQLPDTVQLSFCASADEVQSKLLFPAIAEQQQVETLVNQLVSAIGDTIFAVDNLNGRQGGLVDVIDKLMQKGSHSLAVQETVSQGIIAAKCIAKPWLMTTTFNQSLAKITEKLKVQFNQENYLEMAQNIAWQRQQQEGTDIVLVQLYQGTTQQLQEKTQNIVVYNVLLTPDGIRSSQFSLGGAVQRKQNQAAILALDLLRRYLQKI